ncbi:MAG: hypothetical protein ABWZ79_05880 [Pedobacter agri]
MKKIRQSIRKRLNASKIEQPTVDLVHKAKTRENADITSDDFMTFLEVVKTGIRNRLPKYLTPKEIETNENLRENVYTLNTFIIPQWDSQFKRMINRAIREGNLGIDLIEYFKKEYIGVTNPSFSAKNKREKLEPLERDFDAVETATHTSVPYMSALQNPRYDGTDIVPPGQLMPLKSSLKKFPSGTVGNEINQVYYDDNNQIVAANQINDAPPDIEIYEKYLIALNAVDNYYRVNKDSKKASVTGRLIRNIVKYINRLLQNPSNDDTRLEIYFATATKEITDEYNKIISNTALNSNRLQKLRSETDDLYDSLSALRNKYADIITDTPGYVPSGKIYKNYQELFNDTVKNVEDLRGALYEIMNQNRESELSVEEVSRYEYLAKSLKKRIINLDKNGEKIKDNIDERAKNIIGERKRPYGTEDQIYDSLVRKINRVHGLDYDGFTKIRDQIYSLPEKKISRSKKKELDDILVEKMEIALNAIRERREKEPLDLGDIGMGKPKKTKAKQLITSRKYHVISF